jgi:hypothetical protein
MTKYYPENNVSFENLQNENLQLFFELTKVQNELEFYYLNYQELKNKKINNQDYRNQKENNLINDSSINTLIDNERLKSMIKILQIEKQNNELNVVLGNLLIEITKSPLSAIYLLSKIIRTFFAYKQQIPPKFLGGENFDKVISIYTNKGFSGVDNLLNSILISPKIRANAFTAIAKHLKYIDNKNSVEAARRAYITDPKPYRLKFLAFRLHELGNTIEAAAIFDILPSNIQLSNSETNIAKLLRTGAKHIHYRRVSQDIDHYIENFR